VDTYLKKEPSNALALHFITPLVELAIASGQDERQLADKANGVLRSRLGKAKDSVSGADPAQIIEISTTIHTMARRARSADNLAVLSLCAVYLTKASIHAGHDEALVNLYKEDLHDFTSRKKSGLTGPFFQEFIKKYPSHGWRLRQDLLDVLKGAVNTYRQIQVIQLLQLLLNLLPSFVGAEINFWIPRSFWPFRTYHRTRLKRSCLC
jgi:DNA polymerase phi